MNRVTKKLAPGRVSVPNLRILGQLNFSLVDISKSCSLCEKSFKDHWNLKRHLQRCHNITKTVADDMSIVQETKYQDIQMSDSPKNSLTPSESVEEESDVDNEYYNSILNYDKCEESDDGSRVDNSDFDVEEDTEPNAGISLFNHILNNMSAFANNNESSIDEEDEFRSEVFNSTIHEEAIRKDISFKLPWLDTLWNYQTQKESNILIFKSKILDVTLSDSTKVTAFLNLPSKHIKLLAADPIKKYYKVKIAPVILFLDDTSGNTSKQFNPYESWSMKCAALSFEERCSIENILFISAIPKKKDANAVVLLPEIVDDLKKLENGMVMFSAEDNAYVLVADTPCHSELCGLGAPNSTYPCRKYYIKLQSQIPKLNKVEYYTNRHPTRTKDHYIQAASISDRDTVIPDIPYFDSKNTAEELSLKNKSTDKLLELKAYDQSKDTPAEILHYILLGIAKYLITNLVKVVLNKNKKELEELFDYVKDYTNSRDISRAFTRSLTHAGSFLSRDFKVLIQILPAILAIKFADTEVLQEITPLFVRLGRLCSLVFVRSIDSQYETYISEVDSAIRSLIEALHKYDTNYICLKFGKQYMTRHIIDGGSWIGKNGLRETRGKAIAEYMQQNSDGKFHETLLGGSREFADNNGTGLTPGRILKDNTFSLFRQSNGHIIIGIVLFSKVYHLYIEYLSAHAVNNNYHLALKCADDIYMPLDELKIVCLLDMHLKVSCKYVVNLNKFGSY
ncbi:C2H2-type zinc finger transcription factor [Phycomyces blakesleeanus NRRL 1555(-)]|uniref:C2H2-type zinc finger transcription factor n=1 Tax=Phycomyces blakesleeanus (strain ATCC 8743b / DSM 1359 / FGSC 10004 / NBRC 33097 / NRRL 1555) TaxID=763407 RepID=A0A167KKW3_PHYB8|nr:C2H2-type zinc finger transcription factor [Phycomyces blakesleeanus NRRL 1555(-)]OAD68325.1 C2H2-type zinc finger transcription factor [Phycomyces blakesleeanus NRRL 1555(-)]|eukprot:XP_018286365.1 C2H2-type zinc finger transcription factor [Phycomyces blakesleeanus NRRL 1555(-)]